MGIFWQARRPPENHEEHRIKNRPLTTDHCYWLFRRILRNSSRPSMWRSSKNFTIACRVAPAFTTGGKAPDAIEGERGAGREPRITEAGEIERTSSRNRLPSSSDTLVKEIPKPKL